MWGRMGEDVRGVRSTNRYLQNSRGDVKSSTGNGVAKELICMTHGQKRQRGDCLREWEVVSGGGKGEN